MQWLLLSALTALSCGGKATPKTGEVTIPSPQALESTPDPSAAEAPAEEIEDVPGTFCGDRQCTGETPGCRFDRSKGASECLPLDGDAWPEAAFTAGGALLRCASPKDCPGKACCTGGPLPMTECATDCMSGVDVCDTVEDCPYFVGPPTGCAAHPNNPPFLKTCQYEAQAGNPD